MILCQSYMHTVIFTFVWMGPGSNFLTKVYCEKFSHTQWYTVVHPDLELMGGGGGGWKSTTIHCSSVRYISTMLLVWT